MGTQTGGHSMTGQSPPSSIGEGTMTIRQRLASFGKLLAKWEALKLSFALGAIAGMVFMAVLLTSGKALSNLTGAIGG